VEVKIEIQIGCPGEVNRTARISIDKTELDTVALNIAFPEARNRTGLYMRRHPKRPESAGCFVGPNNPLRSREEPKKMAIHEHLTQMGLGLTVTPRFENDSVERYQTTSALIAVPVSDTVANLLRPCFSQSGLGGRRLFFFEDEPIASRHYWALCCFDGNKGSPRLDMLDVKFDLQCDSIRSIDGRDLSKEGLQWAVSLVPLVKNGKSLSPCEIAQSDYDLRHIFGHSNTEEIASAYDVWYEGWNDRVAQLVSRKLQDGTPFEVYYHSVIGIGSSGAIRILQSDSTLPDLARELAKSGLLAAGLLDSGGSCAVYDNWLGGYLNHGWYFREPRGAILAFRLKAPERIPEPKIGSWIRSRLS
jgi:hypothetical protein